MPPPDATILAGLQAGLVHALKNQAGSLSHQLDTLGQRGDLPPDVRRSLTALRGQALDMGQQMMRLLAIYRLHAHPDALVLNDLRALELLEDVAAALPEAPGSQVRLTIDCPPDLLLVGDEQLLHGALLNLLDNAYRHARQAVQLAAASDGDMVALIVSDDGPGYAETELQPGANALEWSQQRSGLGLYFSDLVARCHRCNDRPGRLERQNHGPLGGASCRLLIPG